MATAAQPMTGDRGDVRTIVGGGVKLGVVTALGVAVFALASRALSGPVEAVVQSVMVLVGGAVFTYAPSYWAQPRGIDGIGHAALLGTLGSVAFTVIDTAILRPLHLYHWTWDAIGGGSGFWYIPVWWMGSAFLATLGAVVTTRGNAALPALVTSALQALVIAVIVFALLAGVRVAPFHAAVAALAFAIGMMLHLIVTVLRSR